MKRFIAKTSEKAAYGNIIRQVREALGYNVGQMKAFLGLKSWNEKGALDGEDAILTFMLAGADQRTLLLIARAALKAHGGIFVPAIPRAAEKILGYFTENRSFFERAYQRHAQIQADRKETLTDEIVSGGKMLAGLVEKLRTVSAATKKNSRRWAKLGEGILAYRRLHNATTLDMSKATDVPCTVIERIEIMGIPGNVEDEESVYVAISNLVSDSPEPVGGPP